MFTINKTIDWLAYLLIGVTFLPTFNYYFPESIIYILLPLLLIVNNHDVFKKKSFIAFVIFLIFVLLDQIFSDNVIMSSYQTSTSYALIFVWTALSFKYKDNKKLYFKCIKAIFLFTLITVLASLYWTYIIPGIVRTTYDNRENFSIYHKYGVMNYNFAQALPLTFPLLIFIAKSEKSKKKYAIYFLVFISLILLFTSTITTSFFIGTIVSIAAFFISTKNVRLYYFSLFVLLVISFFWGNSISVAFLELVQPYSAGTMMESKIIELLEYFKYGDVGSGQMSYRSELQELSWDTFYSNVLIGSHDVTKIGGHAFLADYLAYFGILGFLPFIFFIYFSVSYFLKKVNPRLKPYYTLSVFYFISLSILKGRPMTEMFSMLLFVLPGLSLYASTMYRAATTLKIQK